MKRRGGGEGEARSFLFLEARPPFSWRHDLPCLGGKKQPPLPPPLVLLERKEASLLPLQRLKRIKATHVKLLKRMLRGLELVEDERVGSAARDRRRFASAEAENGKRRRRRSGAGGRAGCAEPRRRLRRCCCCCGSMTRRRHCCRRRQRRRRSARRRHLFGEENRETDLSWKEEKMKNRQAQTEKIKTTGRVRRF